jgi:tetratricopeptide (TPR) repeat protein
MPPSTGNSGPIALQTDEFLLEDLQAAVPPTPQVSVEEALAALKGEGPSQQIALLEKELELEPEKRRRAALEHEIGELQEFRGDDEGGAVKSYGKAFADEPLLRPNLWAIRRICQRRALWPNLLKLIDTEIRMARSPAERAELYAEKGVLLEDRVRDADGARAAYAQAVTEDPTSLPALMALEKLAARDGDVGALADIYRKMATATAEPGRKVVLLIDLARLQAERVGGSVDDTLAILREAYQVGAERGRVLDEIEDVCDEAGRPDDLLEALELRAALVEEQAQAAPPDQAQHFAEGAAAVRRRQAQLARERDPVRAWSYLEQALGKLPEDPLVLADLAELAEDQGRFAELADLLSRRLPRVSPSARPGLLRDRAHALRRAGREEEARAVEAELDEAGDASEGLLFLRERRALAGSDFPSLAALHRKEAERALSGANPAGAADPVWAAGALSAAGAALERAGEIEGALAAYREALAASPGHRPSVDALDRLLDRTGRHAERDELLSTELKSAVAPRSEMLLEALIELKLERLSDVDGAIAMADALCAAKNGDVPRRVLMVELTRAAGKWAEAAEHLAKLAETLQAAGAVERAAEAQLERADLLERKLDQAPAALLLVDEVARAHPGHVRAANELTRLLRAAGKHAELGQAMRRELDATMKPERVDRLLLELADLQARDAGNSDEAGELYRHLLDRTPGHPAALRALAALYEKAGDGKRLGEILEVAAESAPSPEAAAIHLFRLAEVYEAENQPELADEAFNRALQKGGDPSLAVHAIFGRVRALAKRREPALLESALAQLAPFADGAGAEAIAEERAWLAAGIGGDLDGGAERLKAAGGSTAAQVARARIAARSNDAAALGDALDAISRGGSDGELSRALLLRAGLLAIAGGQDGSQRLAAAVEESADPVALVAACDFTDEPGPLAQRARLAEGAAGLEWLLEVVESLEARGRLAEAAAETLRGLGFQPQHLGLLSAARRIAKTGGDRLGYAKATAHLAQVMADPARASSLFAEAGRLFDQLTQARDAIVCWMAVLARSPLDDEAWKRAHDLVAASDDPGGLETLITARLEHTVEGEARITLLLERGELRARTRRPHAALDDYRAVVEIDPRLPEGLRRLGMMLADLGDREAAVTALDGFTEVASDAAELRPVYLRLAELHRAMADPERAAHDLSRVLELDPGDVDAMERLVALHLANRDAPAAAEQLRKRARAAKDGPERAAVEVRLADLYLDKVGDPRAAREALTRALDHEPLRMEAIGKLLPLAEAQGEIQLRDSVLTRAAGEARALIENAPSTASGWQTLERVLAWQHDEDLRVIASQGAALADGKPAPAREGGIEPTRDLSPAGWDKVWPAAGRGGALEIWHEADSAIRVLGDIGSTGVGKNERQNAKGIPLAWIPVDKIARALGAGAAGYELYLHPRERDFARVVGPCVVLGAGHCDKLSSLTRFRVARKLALLKDRLGVLETADEVDLELFFFAVARTVGVAWEPKKRPAEARLEEWTKLVGKALDRKAKKALLGMGHRFAALGDLGAWRKAILGAATRIGLAISGDLGAALKELKLDLASDEGAALARFAISPDLVAIRRELGLRS